MTGKTIASERIVYLDGQFVPESEARISIFDHGVLHGDSVFDACVAWNGAVFKLDQHLDRLYESACGVGIEIPVSKENLAKLLVETVRRNKLQEAYVKTVVTRGVGLYPTLQPVGCKPSIVIFAQPYSSSLIEGKELKTQKLKVSSVRRIPPECIDPKIKSCNYLNHVLAYLDASKAGADNAIELNLQGYVAEVPGYNLFIAKKGELATPVCDILVGITRQTVFELAAEMGITCNATMLTPFDLYNADEVFLSSTAGCIVPISSVDGKTIKDGKPGPITLKINDAYMALMVSKKKSTPI